MPTRQPRSVQIYEFAKAGKSGGYPGVGEPEAGVRQVFKYSEEKRIKKN